MNNPPTLVRASSPIFRHARQVIKRNGQVESVKFDKITSRLEALGYDLNVECSIVTQRIVNEMTDRMHTFELDDLAAQICMSMVLDHSIDYQTLASRIVVSNLHKQTVGPEARYDVETRANKFIYDGHQHSFAMSTCMIHQQVTDWKKVDLSYDGPGFLNPEHVKFIIENAQVLDAAINHDADYDYNFFGLQTLKAQYLMRVIGNRNNHHDKGQIIERPQYMLMREAVGLHRPHVAQIIATYQLLSARRYTHASPTLFNIGKLNPQCSSCFLLRVKGDSITGIYDTLKDCAQISKNAGGIGINVHEIRALGSLIRSSGGRGDGLVPMLKVFEQTARYVNQGGSRKGAFAVYLEPWHADVEEFLMGKFVQKDNSGQVFGINGAAPDLSNRFPDLHLALWVPDLFMKRVKAQENWTLFCPDEAPGLADVYGEEFETLYTRYEKEYQDYLQWAQEHPDQKDNPYVCRGRKIMPATKLFEQIIEAQRLGEPYILYKDACNRKSNQKNLGTIRCSNLCAEIVEFTAPDQVAVCNLASIGLPTHVEEKEGESFFNYEKLYDTAYHAIINLNRILDINWHPIPEAKRSDNLHRPLGLGVQGLADTFIKMGYPWVEEDKNGKQEPHPLARKLNQDIFETIYFAALNASVDLAQKDGPYTSFEGSPASQGQLQFDLWGVTPSTRWDWAGLKNKIKQYGLRNSLLVALMPTASTSQIMGFQESFEPFTQNIYTRKTLAGTFYVFNQYLAKDLEKLGLWHKGIVDQIVANNGSIQNIREIPQRLKNLHRTVYDMKVGPLIKMSAERGPYICQSQSFNVFVKKIEDLVSIHFMTWKYGLKTGSYYVRSGAAAEAIKFTIDPNLEKKMEKKINIPKPTNFVCTDEVCTSCSG